MTLREYVRGFTPDQLKEFSARCETTPGYIKRVAGGHRRAGESLAINIERETGGAITCEELRPDVDWAYLRSTSAGATA